MNFWWGGSDLAVTRFNLVPVAPPDGAFRTYRVAMDSEQSSLEFWSGNARYPKPALLAYTYPRPADIEHAQIEPKAAGWSPEVEEFILDYGDVRDTDDPRVPSPGIRGEHVRSGADLAGWNRELLERRSAT